MDVMKDFATPLPVLVIAQMMGVPQEERPYVRHLAEKLLYIGRGSLIACSRSWRACRG